MDNWYDCYNKKYCCKQNYLKNLEQNSVQTDNLVILQVCGKNNTSLATLPEVPKTLQDVAKSLI